MFLELCNSTYIVMRNVKKQPLGIKSDFINLFMQIPVAEILLKQLSNTLALLSFKLLQITLIQINRPLARCSFDRTFIKIHVGRVSTEKKGIENTISASYRLIYL